jgi:catechol 2,3-dioxygenase-like lactoylglutathione lyase family enzyme
MLNIQSVNHIGIRISDKATSIAFYEKLGFVLKTDAGFEDGHPVIELDAYGHSGGDDMDDYTAHP